MRLLSFLVISLSLAVLVHSERKSDQNIKGPNKIEKVNQLPQTGLKDPPWTAHYCPKCKSKDFGCYPKSSSTGIRTKSGLNCVHTWNRISKDEYLKLPDPDETHYKVTNGKLN
jgi:hypothetical protein